MNLKPTNRREFLQTAVGVAGTTIVAHKAKTASGETENQQVKGDILRAGIIGCDTSHCGAFTKLLNDNNTPADMAGVRVVVAYPSFSEDIKGSVGRVKDISKQLSERWGVKMAGTIEEMLEQVDVVLLMSVDGRRHLAEIKPVAEAGKPVYIDKPFAASLDDAKGMVKIIKEHKLPCFSCSSLRYDSSFTKFMANEKARGKIFGCDAFSPAHQESTNPGFFWYGIHGVEILYTIMGCGCDSVRCTSTEGSDLAVGTWSGGRLGSMRGIREGKRDYGAMVLCQNSFKHLKYSGDYYPNLVREIVKFFKSRKPPFPIEETLEICAFIDAAWRSSKKGGIEVKLSL
jgi:hypothetical protein